jgi:hypothetical protein
MKRRESIILTLGVTMLALSKSSRTQMPTLERNPHSDTEVLVEGWSAAELERILAAFTKDYADGIPPPITFRVKPEHEGVFRIVFPSDIEPRVLSFLVNYLQYPEGYDLAHRAITVLARVTVTAAFPQELSKYVGKKARIYVPSGDRDFDRVYFAIGDQYFEQVFTDMVCRPVSQGRVPEGVRKRWWHE